MLYSWGDNFIFLELGVWGDAPRLVAEISDCSQVLTHLTSHNER